MKRPLTLALALLLALAAGCSPASVPQPGENDARPPGETAATGSSSGPTAGGVTDEVPPAMEPPGAEEPSAEQPSAEPPVPHAAETGCLPSADVDIRPFGGMESTFVTEGLCTTVAPAEEAYLAFYFPPGLPEDAVRSSLEISGGEVVGLSLSAGETLYLRLGPAEPGTETVVRVRGPVGEGGKPADLGFRLRREASPSVAVEIQVGGGPWRPQDPGEFLPPGPVRVKLTFSHPVAADQVEHRFEWELGIRKDRDPVPYQLTWTDPRTLLVDLPEPPPALFVDLAWIRDERGLGIRSGLVNLHAGTPPRLVALDPATGQEEELGPAPIDILWTKASPDGRWVVLEATRPNSTSETDVWLVDTATGAAVKTDLAESPYIPGYYWFPDRLVVAGWDELQEWDLTRQVRRVLPAQAEYAGPLSPDGRYLVGRVLRADPEDPDSLFGLLTVAVYDLATDTERLYSDVGNFRWPQRGGGIPINVPMRWADDGRSLYVLQWSEGSTPADWQTYWSVLDLETGVLAPADDYSADPYSYEPAGPRPVTGPSGWAHLSAGWGAVTLIAPDGQEVAGGEGLPLAWMPDGRLLLVRWPDHAYLRHPGL